MDLKETIQLPGKANNKLNDMVADKKLAWPDRLLIGGLIITLWLVLIVAVLAAATFAIGTQQANSECRAACPIWGMQLQEACHNPELLKNVTGRDATWVINWSNSGG